MEKKRLRAAFAICLFLLAAATVFAAIVLGPLKTFLIISGAGFMIFAALVCATIGLGYPLRLLFTDLLPSLGDMVKIVIWNAEDMKYPPA